MNRGEVYAQSTTRSIEEWTTKSVLQTGRMKNPLNSKTGEEGEVELNAIEIPEDRVEECGKFKIRFRSYTIII